MKRVVATVICFALSTNATTAWAMLDLHTPANERPFESGPFPAFGKTSNGDQQQDTSQQSLVDLFTGAAVTSVSIRVPPGFPSVTPALALDYSSQRSLSPTPFGHSWQMLFGKIERRRKPGVTTLYDQEAFRIETPTFQEDLILIRTEGTLETYGLEHETSFPQITRDIATNNWTVTTTDGVVHAYGASQAARETSLDGTRTFSWHLERVTDPNANRMDYLYQRIGTTLYPQSIRYGGQSLDAHPFSVLFEPFHQPLPEPNRPQPRTDYRAGFPREYRHLVDAISIHVEGTERMRYELTYSDHDRSNQFNLVEVTARAPTDFNTPPRKTSLEYYRTTDAPKHALRLLKSVTYPNGGTFLLGYANAKSLRQEGVLVNSRPHVPAAVVSTVTASDATGRSDTTRYFYEGGHYYFESPLQRQVAGFGRVTVTDPLGHATENYFHQGRGLPPERFFSEDSRPLIGKIYRTVRRDANTGQTRTTYQEWKTTSLGPDRHFVYPELSVEVSEDGTSSRSTATSRIYDATYGNLTESIEYGEVELIADGFEDVASDSRYQIVEYAHNTARHIHNRPRSESLFDHDNNLVSRTVTEYDNLPEGAVDLGNKTHERRWLIEEDRDVVTQYTHTPAGQISLVLSPRQGTTNINYEPLGLYPQEITNPLLQTTSYEFDLFTGQAIRSTDPNGMTAQRTLDGHGRWILQEETDAEGTLQPRIRRVFEEATQPQSLRTSLLLDETDQADTIEYLDGFGRTIQRRTSQADPDVYSVAETTFDALGRDASNSVNVFSAGAAYGPIPADTPKTVTTYDAFDRVIQTSDANGSTTTDYEEGGATKMVADPNNHRTDYTFDAYDRLVGVTEFNREETYQTEFSYDSRDLLVGLQDAEGNLRAFEYDSLGRLRMLEDLHQAENTTPPLWRFAYDDADNVVQTVDPRGQRITAEYDLLDRVQLKTFTDETQQQTQNTYKYDVGDHGIGRLTAIHAPSHAWSARYDVRGRVSHETVHLGGAQFTKSTTYTDFDEPQSVTYPNGEIVFYSYNGAGQLSQLSAGTNVVVGPIDYTADSRIEQIDYQNGLVSKFTYDPAQMLRLSAKQTRLDAELVQDLIYGYDPVGNITQLTDQAPTAINRSLSYSYDDRDRLEMATSAGEATISYSYSPTGNITSLGNSVYQYANEPTDHPHALQSIAEEETSSLTYDLAGNVTQLQRTDAAVRLEWNVRNELAQTEQIARGQLNRTIFAYDDQGRRLRKSNEVYQLPNCGYPSSGGSSSSSSAHVHYGGYGTTIPWPNAHSSGYSSSAFGYGSFSSTSSHFNNSSSSTSSTPATCDPILQSIQTTRYPFSDYLIDPSGATRVTMTADQEHVATVINSTPKKCVSGSDHVACSSIRSIYYHHDDHLGGSSVVTNASGEITQLLDYEPFGSVKTDEQYEDYEATEKFTGYELDDNTGLYYAGARYYHPDLGRFTAIDPLQRKPTELLDRFGEDPQGLNAYSYANNNPLILVDPTGEFAISAILAGVSAVAASYFFAPTDVAYAPAQTPNTRYNEGPSLAEGTLDTSLDELGVPEASAVRSALHVGATAAGAVNAARSLRPLTTTKALGSFVKRRDDIGGTIDRISKGIPHRHRNDGGVFRNRLEGGRRLLPKRQEVDYYREYVQSPSLRKVNGRRILTGKKGEIYYTPDHYQSSVRIDRLNNFLNNVSNR